MFFGPKKTSNKKGSKHDLKIGPSIAYPTKGKGK